MDMLWAGSSPVRPQVLAAQKRPAVAASVEAAAAAHFGDNGPKRRRVVLALKEVCSSDMGSEHSTAGGSSTASEFDEMEMLVMDGLPEPVTRVLSDSLPIDSLPQEIAAPNRKEWDAAEDAAIHSAVQRIGFKWRQIAALLPGRSDDAVRNRWARLNPEASKAEQGGRKAGEKPREKARQDAGAADDGPSKAEQRQAWSAHEDAIIVSSVREMGTRWSSIAQRLPKRTEHAIRNRWHRLQANLGVAAPAAPRAEAAASLA